MKIAIVADPRRKKKDQPLIDEAESKFDEVLYAPITQIRFDILRDSKNDGIRVKFEDQNLSKFDCVLPVPTITHSEIFYTAIWMLDDTFMPFDSKQYMMYMNKELLRNHLRSKGIPIRDSITVASDISVDKILDSVDLPLIVRPPKKRVKVTSKSTLKDVLSLYKYGTPIRIETPIRAERDTWCFVVGDEMIASYVGYQRKKNGKNIPTSGGSDVEKMAVKIRKELGWDYATIRMLKTKDDWIVDRIVMTPNFNRFQEITGSNIARHIMSRMSDESKRREKMWDKHVKKIFKFKLPGL